MSRFCLLIAAVTVAGCGQLPPPGPGEEIDFASWPTPRTGIYPVSVRISADCRAPTPEEVASREETGKKYHGPHYQPAIVVRVNPIGFEAFRDGKFPLPVGTVIVKEKHDSWEVKGPPKEYGAMVKREPGYDPTRGDWEYVYVVRGPEKRVTRGQLESCIYCHVRQMEQDYVFRTYMKP